jgi:hypothetical protein
MTIPFSPAAVPDSGNLAGGAVMDEGCGTIW